MIQNRSYLDKTDEELVTLSLEDKGYYKYLVERYEEKLLRYIVRLSGLSKEDAEDILQDVFIKAYQNLNDFDTGLKFSSWIYRITHNEAITHLRKLKSRPKVIIDQGANDLALNALRADLDIEKNIDKKYLLENITGTIDRLDEKYKNVLVLKYIEDKNYQEMSDILKRPMGTVATLLKRAKEKLNVELLKKSKNFI